MQKEQGYPQKFFDDRPSHPRLGNKSGYGYEFVLHTMPLGAVGKFLTEKINIPTWGRLELVSINVDNNIAHVLTREWGKLDQ